MNNKKFKPDKAAVLDALYGLPGQPPYLPKMVMGECDGETCVSIHWLMYWKKSKIVIRGEFGKN